MGLRSYKIFLVIKHFLFYHPLHNTNDYLVLTDDTTDHVQPRPVGGCLHGVKCVGISVGIDHYAALTENGFLYTWGDGAEGKLG